MVKGKDTSLLNTIMAKINDTDYKSIRGIYILKNIINGKEYIGKSMNIKERMKKHTFSKILTIHKAIQKYGVDNFLVYCEYYPLLSEDELCQLEIEMINQYNTLAPNGYNIVEGGKGLSGYKHTQQTKNIISEKNKGENNYHYGKKLTPETKKKISDANKGRRLSPDQHAKLIVASRSRIGVPRTDEVKRKISEKNKGKKASDETKRKISNGHLGQIPWNRGIKYETPAMTHDEKSREKLRTINLGKKRPIRIILQKTLDDRIIAEYSSLREAEKRTNISRIAISKACRGLRSVIYNYKWEYKS